MPKRRERGLVSEMNRHGTRVWYFRDGHGPRIRIRGEFGSPEFNAAIHAAKGYGSNPVQAKAVLSHQDVNSLAWLIDQYMSSPRFAATAANTQKQRRSILKHVAEKNGAQPFRSLAQSDIENMRDMAAATGKTAQANAVVKAMRALFSWSTPKHTPVDITLAVKGVEHHGESFHLWTEDEIATFEATYPVGTRERLAFTILLWTGARLSDAVQLGDQHVRNGLLSFTPKKTRKKTGARVDMPILPALADALAAGPRGELVWIVGENGLPLTEGGFGHWFRKVCDKAGLAECSAHGLRRACASRLALAGAPVDELKAFLGWTENRTPGVYTRDADNRRLAANAAKRLRAA